jgi:HK97 family phage prohead protease
MSIERRSGEIERRVITGQIELRASAGKNQVGGYAAMFGVPSQDLGGFIEQIAPGAFDQSLAAGDDVLARAEHDSRMLLGRRSSGTLRLSVDGVGLRYEVDLPETSVGNDVRVLCARGDIKQSSFAFFVEDPERDQSWSVTEGGMPLRTLKRVSLVDVAPVASPAYLQTTVSARALDAAKGVVKPMEKPKPDPAQFARAKERRLFRHLTAEQREASFEEKLEAIYMALYALLGSPWPDAGYCMAWDVEATFDERVIIEQGFQLLSYPLSWADNGAPVFGAPTPVEVQYVPKAAPDAAASDVPAGGVAATSAVLPAGDEYDSVQATNEARQKLAEIEG